MLLAVELIIFIQTLIYIMYTFRNLIDGKPEIHFQPQDLDTAL